MPRATLRPYTLYEEVCGYKGCKRNAHALLFLSASLIVTKMLLAINFSESSNKGGVLLDRNSAEYQEILYERTKIAGSLMQGEEKLRRQRFPPIA